MLRIAKDSPSGLLFLLSVCVLAIVTRTAATVIECGKECARCTMKATQTLRNLL
jgi:hypothetical protein